MLERPARPDLDRAWPHIRQTAGLPSGVAFASPANSLADPCAVELRVALEADEHPALYPGPWTPSRVI